MQRKPKLLRDHFAWRLRYDSVTVRCSSLREARQVMACVRWRVRTGMYPIYA